MVKNLIPVIIIIIVCCGFRAYTGQQRGPAVRSPCYGGLQTCVDIPMTMVPVRDDQTYPTPQLIKLQRITLVVVRGDGTWVKHEPSRNGSEGCPYSDNLTLPDANLSTGYQCRTPIATVRELNGNRIWEGTRLCTVIISDFSGNAEILYSIPQGCVAAKAPEPQPARCVLSNRDIVFDHGEMSSQQEGWKEQIIDVDCTREVSAQIGFSPTRVVLSSGITANLEAADTAGGKIHLNKGMNQVSLRSQIRIADGANVGPAVGHSVLTVTLD